VDNLKSMHPENEYIQEELQSIKDKLAKLNSSISSSMRASPGIFQFKNIIIS